MAINLKDLLALDELSTTESVLLWIISDSSVGGICRETNRYFADTIGLSQKRIESMLKSLSDAGFISRSVKYGVRKEVLEREIQVTNVN